jgi:predicted acyl esterase
MLPDVKFGEAQQFKFAGWNNETVHGYVVKPWNYQPGKKYPVAFLIHGGPQGSFGNGWSYRWNPQTYAGQGYAVVMIDFHGSTGYGQAFTDAISQHWGDRPLEDLQKGWDAAQKQFDFLDGGKACALGASYGGYMVNWIAGNWNAPWKCLVTHDGVFDQRMMGYATERLWFSEWGKRRHAVRTSGKLRALQPGQPRQGLEEADPRRAWPAGLPHSGGAGHRRVHRGAAPGHRIEVPVLPRRKPLGAQAAEQRAVARHGQCVVEAAHRPVIRPIRPTEGPALAGPFVFTQPRQ